MRAQEEKVYWTFGSVPERCLRLRSAYKSLAEANALSQLSRADGYRQPCFPGALQQ